MKNQLKAVAHMAYDRVSIRARKINIEYHNVLADIKEEADRKKWEAGNANLCEFCTPNIYCQYHNGKRLHDFPQYTDLTTEEIQYAWEQGCKWMTETLSFKQNETINAWWWSRDNIAHCENCTREELKVNFCAYHLAQWHHDFPEHSTLSATEIAQTWDAVQKKEDA